MDLFHYFDMMMAFSDISVYHSFNEMSIVSHEDLFDMIYYNSSGRRRGKFLSVAVSERDNIVLISNGNGTIWQGGNLSLSTRRSKTYGDGAVYRELMRDWW